MSNNYFQINKNDCDECASKGICSVNPTLTSLQELILLYLKELAFYMLQLNSLGVNNEKINEHIMMALSGVVINAEYSQHEFHQLIVVLYDEIADAKQVYFNLCEKHGIEKNILKTYFKHSKKFTLSEAIKLGEKHFIKKSNLYTEDQKNIYDITVFLIKSIHIKLVELKNLGEKYDDGFLAILSLLNMMNFKEFSMEDSKQKINEAVSKCFELVKHVFWAQQARYGQAEAVEVSTSIRPNKAILVSGYDLTELEAVLELALKRGIDVYTHGQELLFAHTYPKLRAYKNLAGHYGSQFGNYMIDFATFPGPILMTKHTLQKVDFLVRGRLYTADIVASKGVIRLDKGKYGPLIHSALTSEGFENEKQNPSIKVGFSLEKEKRKVNEVLDKMEKGEIKHLFILGILNYASECRSYFEPLVKMIPKDCFVFSLSYDFVGENIYHIKSVFDYSLIYKLFKEMTARKPLSEYPLTMFITKCDKHIMANVINFKNMGIRDLYMCKCPPAIMNPTLTAALIKLFDINELGEPREDLNKILGRE